MQFWKDTFQTWESWRSLLFRIGSKSFTSSYRNFIFVTIVGFHTHAQQWLPVFPEGKSPVQPTSYYSKKLHMYFVTARCGGQNPAFIQKVFCLAAVEQPDASLLKSRDAQCLLSSRAVKGRQQWTRTRTCDKSLFLKDKLLLFDAVYTNRWDGHKCERYGGNFQKVQAAPGHWTRDEVRACFFRFRLCKSKENCWSLLYPFWNIKPACQKWSSCCAHAMDLSTWGRSHWLPKFHLGNWRHSTFLVINYQTIILQFFFFGLATTVGCNTFENNPLIR